jgi:hypothetical protein
MASLCIAFALLNDSRPIRCRAEHSYSVAPQRTSVAILCIAPLCHG